MARKGNIIIRRDKCKGCYLCIRACPAQVLVPDTVPALMGVYPVIAGSSGACTACGACYAVCPDMCITVYRREGDSA